MKQVFAQTVYQPLITDFPKALQGNGGDLGQYVNAVIIFAIGLAGILAVIMIIVGGVQYVSTDSWNDKKDGKNRIMAALGGLLLALASFLILNTIDPNLTTINFKPTQVGGLVTQGGQIGVYNSQTGQFQPLQGPTQNGSTLDTALPSPTSPTWYSNGYVGSVSPNLRATRNNTLAVTPNGLIITPTKVSINTDGSGVPPFIDPTRQPITAYQPNGRNLNANTDFYVVVPLGDERVKNGGKVLVTNQTNGKQLWAVVGDRGPGYGELSLAAARSLGVWREGMGNSADVSQVITYEFYR